MAGKRDLSRLLGKGLSGTEAGRLVISHILELEGGGEGFLSEKDIAAIKAGLQSGSAFDYNRMIDLYRSVREMVIEAQVLSLQCVAALRELEAELERYALSAEVCRLVANLPLLVSQEASMAMQQRQRERLGARLYCLAEVIEERAIERLGGYERVEEASEKDYDAAHAAAAAEIETLIESGVLAPLRLAHKASLFTPKRAQQIQRNDDGLLAELLEGEEITPELVANQAAYAERLAASLAGDDRSEGHDISEWFGEVDQQDEERLLHHYLSGEQLAAAGLPEWQRWLAEFKPWQEGVESDGLAIVVDPIFGDFDSDGRYRSFCLERLADVADVRRREALYAKTCGRPFTDLLADVLAAARRAACQLLAHQQVIGEAGTVARVPFLVDADDTTVNKPRPFPIVDWRRDMLADLKAAAASYNEMADRVHRWRGELRVPRLEAFDLTGLGPDPDTLQLLRQRLALGIGRGGLEADWWREQCTESGNTCEPS